MRREDDPRIKGVENKPTSFQEEVMQSKEALAKKAAGTRRGGAETSKAQIAGTSSAGASSEAGSSSEGSRAPANGRQQVWTVMSGTDDEDSSKAQSSKVQQCNSLEARRPRGEMRALGKQFHIIGEIRSEAIDGATQSGGDAE